jgi:hypothetical protein
MVEDETRQLYMKKIDRRVTSHNDSRKGDGKGEESRPDLMEQLRAYYDHNTDDQDTTNNAFYTNKAILERESLRYHPKILALLDELWLVTDNNGDGQVDRNEYVSMSMKLYRCFVGDGDRENAADIAQKEWENDSFGEKYMNKSKFKQAWFQLADTWTATTSPSEYVIFLQGILQCLTVKQAGKRVWRSDSMIQSFDNFHVEDDRQPGRAAQPRTTAEGCTEPVEEASAIAPREGGTRSPQQQNEEHATGDYHSRGKSAFNPTQGKEPNWASREKGGAAGDPKEKKKKTFALSKEREEARRRSLHERVPHMRRRLSHVPPERLVEMMHSNLLDPPHVYFSEEGMVVENDRLEQVLTKLQSVPPSHLFPESFSPVAIAVGGSNASTTVVPALVVEQPEAIEGQSERGAEVVVVAGGAEVVVEPPAQAQQARRMTRTQPSPWHKERERVRQTRIMQQSASGGVVQTSSSKQKPSSPGLAQTWPGNVEMVTFQESDEEDEEDEGDGAGGMEESTGSTFSLGQSTVRTATFNNASSARGILPGLQAMREKVREKEEEEQQEERRQQRQQWEEEAAAEAAEELEELLAEGPTATREVASASCPSTPTGASTPTGGGTVSTVAGGTSKDDLVLSFPMALWSVRSEEYNQAATWVAADCSAEALKKKQSNTRTRQTAVLRKRAHQKKLRSDYGSFQRMLSPMSGACPRPTRAYAPRTFVKSINEIRSEYDTLSQAATLKHGLKMQKMGGRMSMASSFTPASEAFAQPLRRPASTPGGQRAKITISEGASFESTVKEGMSAGQRPASAGTDFSLLRRTLGATIGSSGVVDVLGNSPAIITKSSVNLKRGGAMA